MSARDGKPGSHAGAQNALNASRFDLDSAIRAVRAEQGSAAQALALEQRLAATLGPSALAGASGASGAGGAWGWLLVLGLGALGALGLHAYEAARPRAASVLHAEPRPHAALSAALAPAVLTEAARPVLTAVQLPEARPLQVQRKAPRRTRVAARPAKNAAKNAPEAVDAAGELALLQRSRAALRSDPAAALALAEQHAHSYPHGMFAQEREVLAIEALLRSHARAAAFSRARAFVAGHPDSPYSMRIRALLAQLPEDPAVDAPRR
jgi:hypothetical protein